MESSFLNEVDRDILEKRFNIKTQAIQSELGDFGSLSQLYERAKEIEAYDREKTLGENVETLCRSMKGVLEVCSRSIRIESYFLPVLPEVQEKVWIQFRNLSVESFNDIYLYYEELIENKAGFRILPKIYKNFGETYIFEYWSHTLELMRDKIEMIVHNLIQQLILVYTVLQIDLLKEESMLKQRLLQESMLTRQQQAKKGIKDKILRREPQAETETLESPPEGFV